MTKKTIKGLTPIGNDLPLSIQDLKSIDTTPPDSSGINLLATDLSHGRPNLPDEEANKLRGMKSSRGTSDEDRLNKLRMYPINR